MRRFLVVNLAAIAVSVVLGCQQTQEPIRRDILGPWKSTDITGVTLRMTVSETAREVTGAGVWITAAKGYGFRVSGALARDEVSLYFDFDERPDVAFHGFFRNETQMEGLLSGGEFQGVTIKFNREGLQR